MDYQEIFLRKGTYKTVYMIVNKLRYNLWHMDKDCYARMQYLKTELQNDEIEDIFLILFSNQCRAKNKVVPIISRMDDMKFSSKVKSGIKIYSNDNPLSYLATQCGIHNSDDRERNRKYRRKKKGIYDINFDNYGEYYMYTPCKDSDNVEIELQKILDTHDFEYIEFDDKRLQYCFLLPDEYKEVIVQLLRRNNNGKFPTKKLVARRLGITYKQLDIKIKSIKRQLEMYAVMNRVD